MVSPCVVPGCKNLGKHRFPKCKMRKTKWIQALKRFNRGINIWANSLICPAHFRPNDFTPTSQYGKQNENARRILKRSAVPSIFLTSSSQDEPSSSQDKPSSSQDEPSSVVVDPLIFDATTVHANYSRNRPVTFVEELPYFNQYASDDEDPLQYQETEEFVDVLNPSDNNMMEIEVSTSERGVTFPVIQNKFDGQHDKSVQTEDGSGLENTNIGEAPITHPETHVKSGQTVSSMSGFSIHFYKDDDKSLHFYTGLENFNKVMLVFHSLGKSAYNLKYFYGKPPDKLDALEQFFLTLIILRRHKTFEELTMLYKITLKQVYTIFITWIRFMALQWRTLDLWIDKEKIRAYMPLDFYNKYPATRTVLDATECPIKKPKLPFAQQVTFSSYKNKNTVKFLIGITPSGLISYVSPCYGGSVTDRQIIERSDILRKFDYNDEIMVDKGLNVQDIFIPYGVKVNMPAFFKKGNQITAGTLVANRKVASKRVHVERIIGMLKTYKILTEPMNQTETLLSSDIVFICAMLVNFRSNIINKDD